MIIERISRSYTLSLIGICIIATTIIVGEDIIDHVLYPWKEVTASPGVSERYIKRDGGIRYIEDTTGDHVRWTIMRRCPGSIFWYKEDSNADDPKGRLTVLPCPLPGTDLTKVHRKSSEGGYRGWRYWIWFLGAPNAAPKKPPTPKPNSKVYVIMV